MKIVLFALLAIVACAALFVRLAPSDPGRWHVTLSFEENTDRPSGVERRVVGGAEKLADLDRVIQATERTDVLAGSVDEGHITYETRSRLWGFPDYTTVETRDGDLLIFARLRFGGSDLGVNKMRVEQWLAELGSS